MSHSESIIAVAVSRARTRVAPRLRHLSGRLVAAWLGLCLGLGSGLLAAGVGKEKIPLDHAPAFLLAGVAPNLIMTIDDSGSMSGSNQAAIEETLPLLDPRDTAALTNSMYYDPSLIYLPPLDATGRPLDHARFDDAPRDFFKNLVASSSVVNCKIDLGLNYVPPWNENAAPCTELSPGGGGIGMSADQNAYAVDRRHPKFRQYRKYLNTESISKSVEDQATAWAKYCLYGEPLTGTAAVSAADDEGDDDAVGEEAIACPAFYYLWDNSRNYGSGDPKPSCGVGLDPKALTAAQAAVALPACLDRIVVGTDEDINQIALTYPTVHEDRAAKLRTADEATTPLSDAYKKTLSKRNFANWYVFYRNRWRTLQTVMSRVAATLEPSVRVTYQGVLLSSGTNINDLETAFGSFDQTRRQAFLNWLFDKRPDAPTLLVAASIRVDNFCRGEKAYRQDPSLGTSSANPLLGCRNNFHLLFTDGSWEDSISANGMSKPVWLGNNDGTLKTLPGDRAYASTFAPAITQYDPNLPATRIYADSNTGGLADTVFASWLDDLRTDLNGEQHRVPVLIRNPAVPAGGTALNVFWNPANDPADWQHVTTYTVGLGVLGEVTPVLLPSGKRSYADGTWGSGQTLRVNGFPDSWTINGFPAAMHPDADPDCYQMDEPPPECFVGITPATGANRVDDLWHAGLNGRGGFFAATNPQALLDSFQQVIDAVSAVAKESAAAASPSFNTGSASTERMAFQARLNSADWTGDVRAFRVSGGLTAPPCPGDKRRGELCEDPNGTPYWSAAAFLDSAAPGALWSNRKLATGSAVYTTSTSGGVETVTAKSSSGLVFAPSSWASLSTDDRNALLQSVTIDNVLAADRSIDVAATALAREAKAKATMDYIAGKRDFESLRRAATDPYEFRDRKSVLGDIINAGPVVVSAPNRYFNDASYVSFASTNATRKEIVYVGANDGLLHAFHAANGQELFGYVPRPLLGKLATLTILGYGKPPNEHDNFVDGPIAEGDAYFRTAAAWNTVLVGALGRGAQAVYAIRSPNLLGAAEVDRTQIHLWDFTDRDDPDMGNVFGKPAIVRVRMSDDSIRWVAVFGNGLNSSLDDGRRALGCDAGDDSGETACGRAVLYVLDIETGALVAKFDTERGRKDDPRHAAAADREPNGLGQPTVIGRAMTDAAGSQLGGGDPIATLAYAGDLFGNLWRFNLSGLSLSGTTGADPVLVFSAKSQADSYAQPITAPVAVASHPTGVGTLVLFGTGRYYAKDDVSDLHTQSFYGIWDRGRAGGLSTALVTGGLLEQELLQTDIDVQSAGSGTAAVASRGRTSSRYAIDWATHNGWRIDLLKPPSDTQEGERVVTGAQLRGDRIVFVSLIPNKNPCKAGGVGWVNALSYSSGAALDDTPFDYDRNGVFDTADLLKPSATDPAVAGSSIQLADSGIYSGPASLPLAGGDTKTVVSSSEGKLVELMESSALRWRVWRQLQ